MPDGLSADEQVRAYKVEAAVRDVIWFITIRARLRQGPAPTRELAYECGATDRGPYLYGHFNKALRRCPGVTKAGTKTMPTGFANNVWALEDLPCPAE